MLVIWAVRADADFSPILEKFYGRKLNVYRFKMNEKSLGAGLIGLGLTALLFGFHWYPQTESMNRSANLAKGMHPARTSSVKAYTPPTSEDGRQACRVLNVYDGDTIGCDLNGDGRIERPEEEVRLLGIDTPERSYSRKNHSYGTAHPTDEPYAKEASEWMERQATGKTVYLQYDLRRNDRYGRTLAFVYPSQQAKTSLNLQAIQQGYAKMLFLGKNRLYEEQFIEAEQKAQASKTGLWGLSQTAGL